MTKLFVICGHGAGDSGAVGNGYKEEDQVRKLGKKIKELGGSNVMLGDVSRNFYKDKGILNLTVSKDYKICELHMDSSPNKKAKGAHVIIKKGFEADKYDKALAEFFGDMFPGRAKKIDGRSDLANVNRAAMKGYNYRLVECGFISNPDDAKKFNDNIEKIAKGILESFGIKAGSSTGDQKPSKPSKPNKPTSTKLAEDGSWGIATTKATQRMLGTTVDGIVSMQPLSNKKYLANAYTGSWKFYSSPKQYKGGSAMVRALQKLIGTKADGWFGKNSVTALQKFLNKKGYNLKVDGSMGPATVKAWQQYINSRL